MHHPKLERQANVNFNSFDAGGKKQHPRLGQVQQVVLFDQGLLADTDILPEGMIQIYIRVRFGGCFFLGNGGVGKGFHRLS